MKSVHVELVPLQEPSQPWNSKPASLRSLACSWICSPGAKVKVHSVGQAIPSRLLLTCPPVRPPCGLPLLSYVITWTVSVEPGGTVGVVVVLGFVPPLV